MKINAEMTNAELLGIFNKMLAKRGLTELASWKLSKAKLIEKILAFKADTITNIVNTALLEVVEQDEKRGSVGHSYEAILEMIKAKHPNAVTTNRTLAWYATQLRSEGHVVPYRPRQKRASKSVEPVEEQAEV